MREIKFRVWNHKTKEMYYEDIIEDLDTIGKITVCQSYGTLFCYYTDDFGDIHELKILQYTGLKDKNGQEIYEGDIVKAWYGVPYDYLSGNGIEKGEVIWNSGFACFSVKTDEIQPTFSCFNDFEVIGNIYENSELLEEAE